MWNGCENMDMEWDERNSMSLLVRSHGGVVVYIIRYGNPSDRIDDGNVVA